MFSKIWNYINENHWLALGIVVAVLMGVWLFGCQSQVRSIRNPSLMVNRVELEAEIKGIEADIVAKVTDLDRQDQVRRMIFEQLSVLAQGGGVNPIGLANSTISIFAVATALNSSTKLKKLKAEKKAEA